MTHVFSIINLKGGVAKTTTAVALAEIFSAELGKKVLVIDLDPQTNATLMLIGEYKWLELNKSNHTLAQLFKGAFPKVIKKFDLDLTLQKSVSDVKNAKTIDLLPSSLDLIDIQDNLIRADRGQFQALTPVSILSRGIGKILNNYDYVIIDCPPNLNLITFNGLFISDTYIIPTIPDILSTYGIPQILNRIRKFSDDVQKDIKPLGIIVTKYQTNSAIHKRTLGDIQAKKEYPPIFKNIIPLANNIAAAADLSDNGQTLKQKYGSGSLSITNALIELAQEIIQRLDT